MQKIDKTAKKTANTIQKQDIQFNCQDGYQLTATLYAPMDKNKHNAILFAPATGIKRGFYNSLATYLCSLGYGCMTFDNRGIGDSLQGDIKDSQASLVEWGEFDLVSAFRTLQEKFPNHNYHIIGHSAGGQLIGLIPDWQNIRSIFNVACSSGQIDLMKQPFRARAKFFMKVFIPMSNRLFGYSKNQWVGMGESLPAQVAQDWADWCSAEGYVETEFGKRIQQHWYDKIDCPSFWLNATDDDIANSATVADMTRVFTKLPVERLELCPKAENLTEIGHMKFFSKKSAKLWYILTEWLEKHS